MRGQSPYPPQGLEADLELLRAQGGDWEPQEILRRFGVAQADQDHLPRLLTAAAVILGAGKMSQLALRMEQTLLRVAPPLRVMRQDASVAHRHDVVQAVLDRIPEALREIRTVRNRADNDVAGLPGGLRGADLAYLTMGIRTLILSSELATRRSPVGIEHALGLVMARPSLAYSEEWVERLFESSVLEGIQLFWAEELGRVILVFDDGRLAYDPAPELSEEDEWS